MAINYRGDENLEFLKYCDNDDLEILVNYLIYDENKKLRTTEELTETEEYKKYGTNYKSYWSKIAAELQYFGGNSVLNTFRGHGVLYREVLTDVCDKMSVQYNNKNSITEMETYLLQKVLSKAIENMTEEELKNIVKDVNIKTTGYTKQAMIAALQTAIKTGGFASYQIAVIVANAVAKIILGRGLTIAANATLTRAISIFAGPIGWIITGLWTALDIAGPAYRVTIPAVIQVAYMRLKYFESK